ncbi:MAG: carboxylesterase family protein, partial [Proteobacteria bacterium]|nr:carboxylesterase family protein [Pseudomonadota bacterium]
GVPYAQSPEDELRWHEPQPVECYPDATGVYDAIEFKNECVQFTTEWENGQMVENPTGDEDCLYLNIWTTADLDVGSEVEPTRPVMVFIHGGGNRSGSGSVVVNQDTRPRYDGMELASHNDSVVVTLNYRLGQFGWLTHSLLAAETEHNVSGNYGLLDQLEALRWIQANIASFGGDANRVMIFGESAGAQDTFLLYASPEAAGLFSSALLQSGVPYFRTKEQALETGGDFVTASGCTDVECLRDMTADEVLRTMRSESGVCTRPGDYQPHIDGWVLPDDPIALVSAPEHNAVPLVIGDNSHETGVNMARGTLEELFGVTLAEEVKGHYPLADYGDDPELRLIAATSDAKFVCPARRMAVAAATHSAPVYRFNFTQTFGGWIFDECVGACHGVELTYVFNRMDIDGYQNATNEERAFAHEIMFAWGRFAATGDPNEAQAALWPEYDDALDTYVELNATGITAEAGWNTAQCDFWDTQDAFPWPE